MMAVQSSFPMPLNPYCPSRPGLNRKKMSPTVFSWTSSHLRYATSRSLLGRRLILRTDRIVSYSTVGKPASRALDAGNAHVSRRSHGGAGGEDLRQLSFR